MNNARCPDHKFEVYERRAVGSWEKRQGGGDTIWIPGVVEICRSCGMMRLRPDDQCLSTEEVVAVR